MPEEGKKLCKGENIEEPHKKIKSRAKKEF